MMKLRVMTRPRGGLLTVSGGLKLVHNLLEFAIPFALHYFVRFIDQVPYLWPAFSRSKYHAVCKEIVSLDLIKLPSHCTTL